ncbi:MAG: biotin transporter BioY, partial [Clostridiales bacterium]|nr:biotin transporter BioY [Clostridiales bacterium]
MKNLNTRDMILVALMATLTTIGAYISILLGPVPFTLQTFFVMLSGMLLGSKKGALSMIVYVSMGLVGMPVFANGMSGLSIITKPSFGYLLGFIIASYVIGKLAEMIKEKENQKMWFTVIPFVGMFIIYLVGVPYLFMIFNTLITPDNPISFATALKYGVTPFILIDSIKAIIAGIVAMAVVPTL